MNLTEEVADGVTGGVTARRSVSSDEGCDDVDDSAQALRNLDVQVGRRQGGHDRHDQEAQVRNQKAKLIIIY